MKGSVIALGRIGDRMAAARVVKGRVEDVIVDAGSEVLRPGTIVRARAGRPMKGQGGLFVDLGRGRSGFLRQWRGVSPGQMVLVEVTGFARDGKAVPVSTRLSVRGRFVVLTPGAPGRNASRAIRDADRRDTLVAMAGQAELAPETGVIIRSRAQNADDLDVRKELEDLAGVVRALVMDGQGGDVEILLDGPDPHEIAWMDWPDADEVDRTPDAFDAHGINDAIFGFQSNVVALASGGRFFVEPTMALVAVDVDTGGRIDPAAALSTNIEVARELPRQLRCRGLGGQITIDFAPVAKRDRQRIVQVLSSSFKGDPDETVLAGWTPLGLFELQRRRSRLPLAEVLG